MSEPNSNPNSNPRSKTSSGADIDPTQVPNEVDPGNQSLNSDFLNETGHFEIEQSTDATTNFDSKTKAEKIPAIDPKLSPRKIGGYEVGRLLGQGGMGRVFQAEDSSGGAVALKLLSPNLSSSAEALARFKQEGLIASQINHPHIVFVHRVDEENGIPFIAMELMTGKTLKDLVVENGPLNFDDAVRLILQCIDGLMEAHGRGMIHRDIKPANCYLDQDGNVKVGDFGLARSLISDSELTQTGAFLGTPLFASPEQLLGQKIDNRSDIYSLSATLYYLLAGKAPFESPNAAQVIARIASSDPPSFESAKVEVPKALEDIVMKGLSRDASKRYATFFEMRDDLLVLLAPKPERASFLRRIVAGIADWFIVSTAFGLLLFMLLPLLGQQQRFAELISIPFVFLYYWICESLLGTSLGKGALHIQVVDIRTGVKPTKWRCFHRTLAYLLVTSGASIAASLTIYLFGITNVFLIGSLQVVGNTVGYAICLFGWYYFKERLMFFDWLSGTACQITPAVQVPFTHLELPAWKPNQIASSQSLPISFGRFQIKSELEPFTRRPEIRWFEGVDPQLERTVWVILSSDPGLELEEIQRSKPKWNRIRFIEEGRHDWGRWFAYVAAEGMPLEQCLSSGVQLSWPQTRSVIGQLAALVERNGQVAELPSSSNLWIDRAGRLSVVDFETKSLTSSLSRSPSDIRPASESIHHRELVRTVCRLALSPHHKFRRKRLSQKARNSSLPVQVLMPLRARKLCESLAAEESAVPMERVVHDFQVASTGPAVVSTKSRFFSSTLSAAFMIPVMTGVWFMLTGPSLIYYGNVLKGLRSAKTLQIMAERDANDEENWKGATAEQKAFCCSLQGKTRINELVETLDLRLKKSYNNFGVIERTIWGQLPLPGLSPTEPSPFRLKGDPVLKTKNAAQLNQPGASGNIRLGNTKLSLIDQIEWNPDHLQRGLKLVDGELDEQVKFDAGEEFPMSVIWWTLAGSIAWTWLTFGGISQYFTGICFVKRDGQKIGFIRSGIRAVLLYLPFMVLIYLIGYWPLVDENDVFWTTQLKRLLAVTPLIYLASTMLKSNRTPLDRLTGTAAVPR